MRPVLIRFLLDRPWLPWSADVQGVPGVGIAFAVALVGLIGVGWLLHTAWDVVHHLRGEPIIPFAHDSSLGCAICDPVIAVWCLAGGPSVPDLLARLRRRPAA